MHEIWKVVLSLSISGTAVIAALFLFCRIFQKKLSRSWQYYIWLIAVIRLLVPFSGTVNLTGRAFAQLERYMDQRAVSAESDSAGVLPDTDKMSVSHPEDARRNSAKTDAAADGSGFSQEGSSAAERDFAVQKTDEVSKEPEKADSSMKIPMTEFLEIWMEYASIFWLLTAAVLLVRRIRMYQSFLRHIRAGSEPAELELLETFGQIAEEMHLRGTVELRINRLAPSPLLAGFLRPMVVLPSEELSEKDFHYTVLHELTHYRRMDVLYKWLVQFTLCLHWFNPFVLLLGREVNRACELACDEAVLKKLTAEEKKAYGDTLLQAAKQSCPQKHCAGALTLQESGKQLKERLEAVMEHRKRPAFVKILSLILAAGVTAGAAGLGAYAGPGTAVPVSGWEEKTAHVSGDEEELHFTSGGNDFLLSDGTGVIERDQVLYILCDGVTEEKLPLAGVVEGTMIMVVHQEPADSVILSISVTLSEDRSEILEEAEEICREMQQKGTLSEKDAALILETAEELQKRERSLLQPDLFDGSYYQNAYYQAPYLFFVGYDLTEEAVKQCAGTEIVLEDGERLYVSFADSDRIWMEDETFIKILSAQFSELRSRTDSRISGIRRPIVRGVETVGYDVEGLTAKYYAEDDMGYFSVMVAELPADRQQKYLELACQEDNAAVFSIVLYSLDRKGELGEDQIDSWMSRAYEEDNVAFFSILTGYLSEEAKQEWYTRLMQEEERKLSFVAVLRELLYDEEEDWKDDFQEDLEDIWW